MSRAPTQTVAINLARPPGHAWLPTKQRWLALAASALSITLLLTVLVYGGLLTQERNSLRSVWLAQQQTMVAHQTSASHTFNPAQTQELNGAIRRLNTPWPAIFAAIESATPAAVAILSVEPDEKTETLVIVGETRTFDQALTLVDRLSADPLFARASLMKHEVNDKDSAKPIRFRVEAHLRTESH